MPKLTTADCATATVLGFDPGNKHIGVAVGETLLGAAKALEVLPTKQGEPNWNRVKCLIDKWRPDFVIVGLPCHADGTDSHSTIAAKRFVNQLRNRCGVTVKTVDERLSSHEAEQRLRNRGKKHDSLALHSEAAAVILETFLAQVMT